LECTVQASRNHSGLQIFPGDFLPQKYRPEPILEHLVEKD